MLLTSEAQSHPDSTLLLRVRDPIDVSVGLWAEGMPGGPVRQSLVAAPWVLLL